MELQKLIDGLKAHKSGAASYESVDEAIRVFKAMQTVKGWEVVKGLDICTESEEYDACKTCPYYGDYPNVCRYVNKRDALALIRQQAEKIHELQTKVHELQTVQTARVMTLGDVENALDTVVWVEEPEFENFSYHYALIMAYSHKLGFTRVWFAFSAPSVDVEYKYADYGKKWRCWTQRPTDEQRKAVPWE